MLQTLLAGLIVAAFGGVTFVAYQHPTQFRSYAKELNRLLGFVAFGVVGFFLAGIAYVGIAEPVVGREVTDKVSQAVYAQIGTPALWIFGTALGLKAYGWFLLKFVAPLREPASVQESKTDKAL